MIASRSVTTAVILAITTFVAAQNSSQTQVALPFFGYDNQPIDASVLSANSQATTLVLNCRPGTDQNDCGLFPSQTLIVGPSTYHMDESAPDFTGTQDCNAAATTQAVCTESNGGSGANFPGSSVTTYSSDEIATITVTITAGVDRLSGSGAPATTTASSTSTGTGSESSAMTTATDSSAMTTSSSAATNTASTGTQSAASTSSTGLANLISSKDSFGLIGMAAGLMGYLIV